MARRARHVPEEPVDLDDPLDLEELKRSAAKDGESAVVSRSWLRQVLAEITAGREAQARAGQCFGLPPGQSI